MAISNRGILARCLYAWGSKIVPSCGFLKTNELCQIRKYAARKGTREKARKKKVKVEVKKTEFIPHNLREKNLKDTPATTRVDDCHKGVSPDDVWIGKYYKWRVYSFEEAVQCHCETHHPNIYNCPRAPLNVTIELDMKADKKNKFLGDIKDIVSIPHPFSLEQLRTIIAFSKTPEHSTEALEAGAALAGGLDLIKNIQNGALSLQDFEFVVAHPNILPELVAIRGLMKRKFPNIKSGSLGADMEEMVTKFRNGIQYTSLKDDRQEDYAWINTTVGFLNMDVTHLEGNFAALIRSVLGSKPRKQGTLITRVLLASPPSVERLKVDMGPYLPDQGDQQAEESDEDDEGEEDKMSKVAV